MTDRQACRLRARLWLAVPSDDRPGVALEVQLHAGHLVPVITLRNLSLSTAWSGLLAFTAAAQIRFDNAPMAELPCTLDAVSVVCAPVKEDVSRLAEELVDARTVLVRLRAVANLPMPMPDGTLALDLDHTQEALARYRAAGPEVAPLASSLTLDLKAAAEQLLRSLGVTGSEPEPAAPK